MKKRQLVILSIIVILIASISIKIYVDYEAGKKHKPEHKKSLRYAKVSVVKNEPVRVFINGFGRVNPALVVNIAPEVSGVLMHGDIPLKKGVRFRKGQVLFKIDNREFALGLKASKSSFLNLMAGALADIKMDYPESYDKWFDFYSSLDVSKPFPELPPGSTLQEKTFLASQNVLSQYYTIKKDEIRLSKYTVHAPFTGFFAEVMIQQGSFIGIGMAVATLNQNADMEIIMPIEKQDVQMVKTGQAVNISTPNKSITREGRVKRVEQLVNANTQSINVYITPKGSLENLYPGMYLELSIEAGTVKNSFELPRKALTNENKVLVIRDSILFKVSVDIIKRNQNSLIVKGIPDGDLLILEQLPNAENGEKIIPIL